MARLGDPGIATFVRSAAKPFQALPLVLAGGIERFGLDDADLALICASHGGTPEHVRRVESLLERGGFAAGDLQCGAHLPLDRESAARLERQELAPSPLHNNCSGKHAGMLLACRLLGLPTGSYLSPEHPLQTSVLEHMGPAQRSAGRDDRHRDRRCSVPTWHLPVEAAARSYAVLAHSGAPGWRQIWRGPWSGSWERWAGLRRWWRGRDGSPPA